MKCLHAICYKLLLLKVPGDRNGTNGASVFHRRSISGEVLAAQQVVIRMRNKPEAQQKQEVT
jgi:hypothetical protein